MHVAGQRLMQSAVIRVLLPKQPSDGLQGSSLHNWVCNFSPEHLPPPFFAPPQSRVLVRLPPSQGWLQVDHVVQDDHLPSNGQAITWQDSTSSNSTFSQFSIFRLFIEIFRLFTRIPTPHESEHFDQSDHDVIRHSSQYFSSEPSSQSVTPSHMPLYSMHWFLLEHPNWYSLQVTGVLLPSGLPLGDGVVTSVMSPSSSVVESVQ